MSGLRINGAIVQVEGVEIIGPHETKWAHLNAGDGMPRRHKVVQQAILHKTSADDPERVLPGKGPPGGDEVIAEMWDEDPHHSGAQLVTACDGRTSCLEDLVAWMAWHGNQGNTYSYGHELKEMPGGVVYQATLDAGVAVTLAATRALGIQWQCPRAYIDDRPLTRFVDGGSTLFGIFGHRDITTLRGRWDPGERIFEMLAAAGAERFDFEAGEDRDVWRDRQVWLASLGFYRGEIDGLPGPKTTSALRALGFPDGIFGAWRLAPTRPPLPPGYDG